MTDLLIEILSEEIPARYQPKNSGRRFEGKFIVEFYGISWFLGNLIENLEYNGFEFDSECNNFELYSTPRRMAVVIKGLPEKQPDINEERKGPKVGSPEQAMAGFLKSVGAKMDELIEKDGVYYFQINKKGQATTDILPEIINKSVNDIHWAKSMRFADSDFRFVRPLRQIVAVFGNEKVSGKFELDKTIFDYTDKTLGHRFLSDGEISVNAENYEKQLLNEGIIVNRENRKAEILKQLNELAKKKSVELITDNGLLDEVTGLVEMPVALIGDIEDRFMKLPKEVLIRSMKEHQKFFVFADKDGNLAPYFATVANIKASDGGKAIVAGNERVLRARLADSEFFYHNDLNVKLEENLPKLEKMTFHEKLGTVADRVKRIESISENVAKQIKADVSDTVRASQLCKCDLVSHMVNEFAKLQGIMGSYYAIHQGENEIVANAIATHYQPQGEKDNVPTDKVAISVSVAEKLDTLVGFWLIDEKPTGSKDPYALRRCALGIIRMILENELPIDLAGLIDESFRIYKLDFHTKVSELNIKLGAPYIIEKIQDDLLSFFADRVKSHMKSSGVRHDIIGAVLSNGITDLIAQTRLADELSDNSQVVSQVKENYTRAKNITDKIDNLKFGAVDEKLLTEPAEAKLHSQLKTAQTSIKNSLTDEDFKSAVSVLANLAPVLADFFENVMVNTDDKALQNNRLNLLGEIIGTADVVADFGIIE